MGTNDTDQAARLETAQARSEAPTPHPADRRFPGVHKPIVAFDVEVDGRHIADASALVPGAMAYGNTRDEAEAAALAIATGRV